MKDHEIVIPETGFSSTAEATAANVDVEHKGSADALVTSVISQSNSLSGKKLKQHLKKQEYSMIDRFITSHPEFEQIKDEAKKNVISRVKEY